MTKDLLPLYGARPEDQGNPHHRMTKAWLTWEISRRHPAVTSIRLSDCKDDPVIGFGHVEIWLGLDDDAALRAIAADLRRNVLPLIWTSNINVDAR